MTLAELAARSIVVNSQYVRAALVVACGLIGVALVAYAINGYYTRFWSDDYCISGKMHELGFWGVQAHYFENWTGRFSYTFTSTTLVRLGLGFVPFFAAVILAGWLAALCWTTHQAGRLLFGATGWLPVLLMACVLLFSYVTASPNRVQTVYWLIGFANYTAPLILMTLYAGFICWCMRRGLEVSRPTLMGLSFVAMFVGGGFAETYLVWQACVVGLALVAAWRFLKGAQRSLMVGLLIAGFLGTLLGGAVMGLSPGNDERAALFPPRMPVYEAVVYGLRDAVPGMARLVIMPSMLMSGAAAMLVSCLLQRDEQVLSPRAVALRLGIAGVLCYLLVSTAYSPSYYVTHREPELRSLASAQMTVILALVYAGYVAGRYLRGGGFRIASNKPTLTLVAGAGLILIGLVSLPSAKVQLERRAGLERYAERWDARHERLLASAKAGETVAREVAVPRSGNVDEISFDTTFYFNECVARYYGFERVERREN